LLLLESLLDELIDFLGSPGTTFLILAKTTFIRLFNFYAPRLPSSIPPVQNVVHVRLRHLVIDLELLCSQNCVSSLTPIFLAVRYEKHEWNNFHNRTEGQL
jgi:hypothetical protein